MTTKTTETYICDGCLIDSQDKKFIVVSYELAKHFPHEHGKPPTKYKRDYCKTCAPKVVEAHKEGAFTDYKKEKGK